MIRLIALCAGGVFLLIVLYATFSPLDWRPRTGYVAVERFVAFALVAFCFGVGFPEQLMVVMIVLACCAGGLELAQALTPDRHPGLWDAVEKISGVVAGGGVAFLVVHWLAR